MGVDISGGLFYGAFLDEGIAESIRESYLEVRYDTHTGKKYTDVETKWVFKMLIDIPYFKIKKGDIYLQSFDYESNKEYLAKLIKEPFYLSDKNGISIPVCETDWVCPQDFFKDVINLDNLIANAIKEWNEVFPTIPGRLSVGVKYSY